MLGLVELQEFSAEINLVAVELGPGVREGTDPAAAQVKGRLNLHILWLEREELVVLVGALIGRLGLGLEDLEFHLLESLAAVLVNTLVAERVDKILAKRAPVCVVPRQGLALGQ